jgi:hypothetical protein
MNNKLLGRLSQAELNLLETCPPQFQRLYLEQLGAPITPEQQEKLSWGNQFHLLMQQRELGLPIEPILEEDKQLEHSIEALIEAVPEILQSDGKTWREAEHYRCLNFQGYLLTVVYDLLIADVEVAKILDWKTYLQPENKTKLAKNWQTRLYLYVLAETSHYLPEQISLTYWFVKLPRKPQSLTFNYSEKQHKKTEKDLQKILNQLNCWLEDYCQKDISFPHLKNCQQTCPYYQSLLLASEKILSKQNVQLIDINKIEEISI